MALPRTRSIPRRAASANRLRRFTRTAPRWGGGVTGPGRRGGGFRPSVRLNNSRVSRRRRGSAGKTLRR